MKILRSDYKKGLLKLKILTLDDLWYLSHILRENDYLSGSTYRKIMYNEKEGDRKRLYLKIKVEKIEFHEFSNVLRALGKIKKTSDENVPLGDYHSFNIKAGDVITIEKKKGWRNTDKNYLKRALKKSGADLMIIACDWGDASFAFYHEYGLEYAGTLSEELGGKKEVKRFEKNKKAFLKELLKTINTISKNRGVDKVLIGGASMITDSLKKLIKDYDYIKDKNVLVRINYAGKNGVKELIEKGYVDKILSENVYSKQVNLVKKLLKRVGKEGKATYGFKPVVEAVKLGAVKHLIITGDYVKKKRQEAEYKELDDLIQLVEDTGGEVHIIPSNTEHGENVDNLSGITALLRYKIQN